MLALLLSSLGGRGPRSKQRIMSRKSFSSRVRRVAFHLHANIKVVESILLHSSLSCSPGSRHQFPTEGRYQGIFPFWRTIPEIEAHQVSNHVGHSTLPPRYCRYTQQHQHPPSHRIFLFQFPPLQPRVSAAHPSPHSDGHEPRPSASAVSIRYLSM